MSITKPSTLSHTTTIIMEVMIMLYLQKNITISISRNLMSHIQTMVYPTIRHMEVCSKSHIMTIMTINLYYSQIILMDQTQQHLGLVYSPQDMMALR